MVTSMCRRRKESLPPRPLPPHTRHGERHVVHRNREWAQGSDNQSASKLREPRILSLQLRWHLYCLQPFILKPLPQIWHE
jgi:hypothetical protein